ncbi:MAG: hypothetical protein ACREVS_08595 [Burkholderiales bacterium]
MLTTTTDAAAGSRIDGLERAIQFGPGMRVQRLVEAAFLVAAIFAHDLRFAYVTLFLSVLQALSPRWVPIARAVARVVHFRGEHRIGDLYFDLGGIRGASAISVVAQAVGIGLVWMGHTMVGFMVLTLPTASFLMAPTLGFCCGCWFYVLGRDWLARRGWLRRGFHDIGDVAIARDDGPD